MTEDDKIKYSDIIQPDDAIEKLISQLGEFSKQYGIMVNAIRAGAEKIVHALKSTSGATSEGRKSIDEAAISASRLERAQYELSLAMSDTGKQIAWLKAQTADQNKTTVEQRRYIKLAISSYDRLKADLKETTSLYKSLTASERADSEMGKQLLQDIINLKNQIKALDDKMRPHIETLTEVQKAEQKLAYLQSAEGQRLLDLKAKIAEVIAARRQQKEVIDPIVQAQQKLAYARSEENKQLKGYALQTKEANKIAQLEAIIASSKRGSYNQLAAMYELNKIKLNAMSGAMREGTITGRQLEAQTALIHSKMVKLQEATGNYTLSVGHYQKAWSGLGFSIQQVARELPSLAISANTFFLAISNNIPIVVDEINKVRAENARLRAEGRPTRNIVNEIVKSIFSWQSALVILLTVFSMYGKQILDFIAKTIKGKDTVISMGKAIKNVNEELSKNAQGYGKHITELRKLQSEWKALTNTKERLQWIKDNKSAFDALDISVNNVNDAERVFVYKTQALVDALKNRAKAAAAIELAAKKYEEALQKQVDADRIAKERDKKLKKIPKGTTGSIAIGGSITGYTQTVEYDARKKIEDTANIRIKKLKEEQKVLEGTAETYFSIAKAEEKEAAARLKAAGIDTAHKITKESKIRTKEAKDLTNTIYKNELTIRKQYEASITKLTNDEYDKRRKAAWDEVRDENDRLRELQRRNEEYVKNTSGKYKTLTEEQKKQIANQNKLIEETIANNQHVLEVQIRRIVNEQNISKEQLAQYAKQTTVSSAGSGIGVATPHYTQVETSLDDLEASLIREKKLVENSLNVEYALTIETNKKLREANDEHARDEEDILNEWNAKRVKIWAEYDKKILDQRARNIDDQLLLVKKGSDRELELIKERLEVEKQIELAENAAKPASQQVSSSAIEAKYGKKTSLAAGSFAIEQFEQQQALDAAKFNEVKHTDIAITRFQLKQERDLWKKKIELAESGGLDWSDTQIEAAKSTVKGINNELKRLGNEFIGSIGKYGAAGSLLAGLGFDEEGIAAFNKAVSTVISNLQDIMQAEIDLAQAAVEAAEERTQAAQAAYDAEVEARNNGYANNVATAKKELQQKKQEEAQKQAILEQAQRRKERLDTATQTSSLITASAQIWSAMSGVPIIGPALALAAIASMWTSFAVAKVKARQVAVQSEEYGEGGLEFLEGGSHASGHDIDLGVNNKRRRRMRAEGGEALAIINRRHTHKYRAMLPDIIDSLNKGIFEDKYMNAFDGADKVRQLVVQQAPIDLSDLERNVRAIKKQNEDKYAILPDGSTVIYHNNIKRIIRK